MLNSIQLIKKLNSWMIVIASACLVPSTWAYELVTPATHVVGVDLTPSSSGSSDMVDVILSATSSLHSNCNGKVRFVYSAGTASEVYYSLLMTAKSANLQVYVRYDEGGMLGCTLNSVVTTEGVLPGT